MELTCYVFPGWEPRIRPASPKRGWMDEAPESYPYRCLPLTIANSHGWEILSPCGFEAEWNGGMAVEDVIVRADPGTLAHEAPVALFGLGTFTIHVQGLFRTPAGWNLFAGGPPNCTKDGVVPLAGIIETDWAPYTFTMNWRLTRANHVVRFDLDESIAHIFPIERSVIEDIAPRFVPIDENPELKASFEAWSRSRDAFQRHVREHPPKKPADKWQKLYYRGLMPDERCPITDHQTKLRVREFANAALVEPAPRAGREVVLPERSLPPMRPVASEAGWKVAKYEWLFETMERQRALSVNASGVFRCADLTAEDFLDNFYAPGRPVILCGAIDGWPALGKWTPDYLREEIGSATIECQGGRRGSTRFELDKDSHKRQMPFDRFIDQIVEVSGNDLYLTAYNSASNAAALAPLAADLGSIPALLDDASGQDASMMWIGPQGTFTPLHHDLTNNLIVQIVGRKRVVMASPAETPKLYNHLHVFSEIGNLTDPQLDLSAYPKLGDVRLLELVIEPGEVLFVPIGWWHQVEALDFSVSMTYTNFRWANEGYREHPERG
ncbi:DUF6065 family protein [Sphingomonas sp.]|uniref:DUF6065 family protein n=1 Tax=Sphingomonas sp. TaxID=28214 RepID=UPI00286BD784|nr:DUF6065 family protein [Sphingomonas sp.]